MLLSFCKQCCGESPSSAEKPACWVTVPASPTHLQYSVPLLRVRQVALLMQGTLSSTHCRAARDKRHESVSSDISRTTGKILSVYNSLHILMALLTRLIKVDALPFHFLLFVLIFFAITLSDMLVTQEKPTTTVLIKLLQRLV